jgi:hypothetical protein
MDWSKDKHEAYLQLVTFFKTYHCARSWDLFPWSDDPSEAKEQIHELRIMLHQAQEAEEYAEREEILTSYRQHIDRIRRAGAPINAAQVNGK